ncbi:hypothetical protein [Xanthomonas sp. CFBP 8445]|uniref:hypothetical protein n=1 Tax=Xanthomonas sp. CFBP 8445 TaxID=2971236 RepID=UPI0021DFECEE|nr:hypothetical protein [Xanthomonas sp. CFBP 8445]UYC12295.1 hypothetical protein NUG21_00630 [Xanthomonas sp. CFBP 8445]
MLIGYGQPALAPSIDGATATNLSALVDGRPSSVARVSGGGSGGVRLRADWATATSVRIVAALGLTCTAGTALELTGKRAGDSEYGYALGGTATTQPVVELVDGSRAAWWVLPEGNARLVGLQLEVAAGAFDIGELIVLQGVELPHEPGSSWDRIDPSIVARTIGGALNVIPRRTYRRLRVRPTADYLDAVRGGGLANGMDWDKLVYALSASARVAALLRWDDAAELHRTAVYGTAAAAAITHRAGPMFNTEQWTFEEIPPI